ncbi:MAG: hypothetical protein ACFFD1_04515 [Candidatus Thorarchaeota archaeon]
MESSNYPHMHCPYCDDVIISFSKNCPTCGRQLLTQDDIQSLKDWLYSTESKEQDQGSKESIPVPPRKFKIPHNRRIFRFDPITWELLRGAIRSYVKHSYYFIFLLGFIYLGLFTTIAGIFSLFDQKIEILFPGFAPLQIIVGGTLNFALTMLVASIGERKAFKNTLEHGELGIKFKFYGSSIKIFSYFFGYIILFVTYFILWASLFHLPMLLDKNVWMNTTTIYENGGPNIIYRIVLIIILSILVIILLSIMFAATVKGAYFIFQLDKNIIPTDAIDGPLVLIGLIYGVFIVLLRIFPIFGQELVTLVTFMLPGIVLIPLFGYAMAHLKTAASVYTLPNQVT